MVYGGIAIEVFADGRCKKYEYKGSIIIMTKLGSAALFKLKEPFPSYLANEGIIKKLSPDKLKVLLAALGGRNIKEIIESNMITIECESSENKYTCFCPNDRGLHSILIGLNNFGKLKRENK